jgi:hypothetical protein
MRYLVFKDESSTAYEMLHQGIHSTSRPYTGAETRIIDKALTKIEAIGHSTGQKLGDGGELYVWKMNEDGGVIALEDAEFSLVMSAIEKTPWSAAGARKVPALLDIMEKAPTTPPVVKVD